MNRALLFLTLVVFPQTEFAEFSYCREGPREGDPVHCLYLNDEGAGQFEIRPGATDENTGDMLELSPRALNEFLGLLEGTDYLSDGDEYESSRSVANLGRKTMSLEGAWGRRDASFNYSSRSEVNRLVTFLDRLVTQQLVVLDLDFALQYDRLVLPTVLERIEEGLRGNRYADPLGLVPHLSRVTGDTRVVNYARATAERLIEDIDDE